MVDASDDENVKIFFDKIIRLEDEWESGGVVGKTKKQRICERVCQKKKTDTLVTCGSAKRGVCVCVMYFKNL